MSITITSVAVRAENREYILARMSENGLVVSIALNGHNELDLSRDAAMALRDALMGLLPVTWP